MSHIERHAYAHQAHIDSESDAEYLQCESETRAFETLHNEFLSAVKTGNHETKIGYPQSDSALASFLPVSERNWTIRHQRLSCSIFDVICNSERFDALIVEMLSKSDCPIVARLKNRMAEEWAEMHCEGMAQIEMQNGEQP